ncbi:MAG: delta-60 repeat domain-containing protein, partial [Prosthecobacter sp.]|nr:delta-60 repeat domain-containing protein [Prosthecobacter sp.]
MKALLTTLLLFSLLSLSTLQAALPGELDPTFATGSGINGEVYAIARQKDGRILIGGSFTSVQGVPRKSIARLMSNGALDLSFDPGSGANSNVLSLFLQPDGRILMAGSFLSYAGYSCVRLIRLLPDGAVDPSFQLTAGPDGDVAAIRADANGKIYIGGSFHAFGAETRKGVARLNANGTLDSG